MAPNRRVGPFRRHRKGRIEADLRAIVRWYFRNVYGLHEGPGVLPFYCDRERVGHFAIEPARYHDGSEAELFRLFVSLAMYQARRDVVIENQQLAFSRKEATAMLSLPALRRRIRTNPCPVLRSAESFDAGCTVRKRGEVSDCELRPEQECHVKEASRLFNRMADLGKLPTSAHLRLWRRGAFGRTVREAIEAESDPRVRAERLVDAFTRVHRVGRKLATMFVSALSVPSLAPGLTPWFPRIDGNDLVVVDTNVLRAVRALAGAAAPVGYEGHARWLRAAARLIDLREHRSELPAYSPRLVQQALYRFASRSNRAARGDACSRDPGPCSECVPACCPFQEIRPVRLTKPVRGGSNTQNNEAWANSPGVREEPLVVQAGLRSPP